LFADTDLRSQGGKLMAAIGMVVHALDAPESMVEKVKELARRHVEYGVENRHYATVGAALLWTLQVGLGEAFTPELRDAWASAYQILSGRMMEAAREAVPAHQTTYFGQPAEGPVGCLGKKNKRPIGGPRTMAAPRLPRTSRHWHPWATMPRIRPPDTMSMPGVGPAGNPLAPDPLASASISTESAPVVTERVGLERRNASQPLTLWWRECLACGR